MEARIDVLRSLKVNWGEERNWPIAASWAMCFSGDAKSWALGEGKIKEGFSEEST